MLVPTGSVHYTSEWSLDYFGRHFGWYCGHGSHVLQKKASGGRNIMYTWLGNIYFYVPLTISIGTDITKTWAEYCSKHCDVSGELSHPHRDVAIQTGDNYRWYYCTVSTIGSVVCHKRRWIEPKGQIITVTADPWTWPKTKHLFSKISPSLYFCLHYLLILFPD